MSKNLAVHAYIHFTSIFFTVATVSFDAANFTVVERAGSLRINVTRSGNLQNTSVVLVATDNFQGTASGKRLLWVASKNSFLINE